MIDERTIFGNRNDRAARIFADGEKVLCKEEMPYTVVSSIDSRYYKLIGEKTFFIAILQEPEGTETHEVRYSDILFDFEKQITYSATSDERVKNNVMRHEYKILTDKEKDQMKKIKDMGLDFHEYLGTIGNSRELSLAKTKIEEAVMWAVKHVTR